MFKHEMPNSCKDCPVVNIMSQIRITNQELRMLKMIENAKQNFIKTNLSEYGFSVN